MNENYSEDFDLKQALKKEQELTYLIQPLLYKISLAYKTLIVYQIVLYWFLYQFITFNNSGNNRLIVTDSKSLLLYKDAVWASTVASPCPHPASRPCPTVSCPTVALMPPTEMQVLNPNAAPTPCRQLHHTSRNCGHVRPP